MKRKANKEQIIDGLKKSFEVFKTITDFQRINVETILKKNGIPNYVVIGMAIRKDFFVPGKTSGYHRFNLTDWTAKKPTDLFIYYQNSKDKYYEFLKNKTEKKPRKNHKVKQTIRSRADEARILKLKDYLLFAKKNYQDFSHISFRKDMIERDIPSSRILCIPVMRDFFERGEGSSVYRWKPGSEIPDNIVKYYYESIREYIKNTPSGKSKKRKHHKIEKNPLLIKHLAKKNNDPAIKQQIVDVLTVIQHKNSTDAKNIIDRYQVLNGTLRNQIYRAHADGLITTDKIDALANKLSQIASIETPVIPPVIDKNSMFENELQEKIYMTILNTLLPHYHVLKTTLDKYKISMDELADYASKNETSR